MCGLRGETTVDRVHDQLDTIFTHLEIKWNRSLEFENDKLSDLCAGWRDESYDKVGLPQAALNVLGDGQETTQKQMTKYSIVAKKKVRGAVLDSPSKGKTTETCVVEGRMSVCPACFEDWLSHWSFDPLLDITE